MGDTEFSLHVQACGTSVGGPYIKTGTETQNPQICEIFKSRYMVWVVRGGGGEVKTDTESQSTQICQLVIYMELGWVVKIDTETQFNF